MNCQSLRKGVTGMPITSANVTHVLPVCHGKIHIFDWILKRLLVKQISNCKWLCASNPVHFTKEEKDLEHHEWQVLKDKVKAELGNPSDKVAGNKFKMFSSDVPGKN